MKLYLNIVLLLFCNCLLAQLPVLSTTSLANPNDNFKHTENGNYAKDLGNERDQYIGTWQYNQNGILFQVKMEKKDQYLNKTEYNGQVVSYNYRDGIIFRYKLVKNGVVIYDDLNQSVFPDGYNASIATKQGGYNYLYGSFIDRTRNVGGRVTITKLNTVPAKIIFNVPLGAYYLLNPREYYDDGQPLFTFPTGGIEMVKIQ
jgi:hypothetical protein